MRRLLIALAVFFTVTPATSFGGYIIIRVLLEGGGAGGDGVPGGPGGVVQPPPGFGGGPPGMSGFGPGPRPGQGVMPPPGMPGGGMPGGAPATGLVELDHARAIVAVIPLETDFVNKRLDQKLKFFMVENNPEYRQFQVKYYDKTLKASLFIDSSTIQLYEQLLGTPGVKKTRHTEMRERFAVWDKNKTDVQALYDAIVLALRSGFVKEALDYSDKLLKVAAEGKVTLPERDVKPFVAAWSVMQKAVTEPSPLPSDAEDWRGRLDYKSVRVAGHYAVVYGDSTSAEVERRVAQLNDNFAAFFLSHATRGITLTVPDKPLVAVLASQGATMRDLRLALDGLPMSDAFYAPDHNLVVLSPERLDDVGQTFLRQNQQVFAKGLNRDQILSGLIPKIDFTGQNGPKPDDVARASTLAAVEKVATDEADIAAVSREGTRQLLYATGTLPKHVTLPTWLSNGAVNYYTRPRGPAYVTVGDDDKPFMSVALTTGYGVPNYVLQRYFRDLATKKELPADPARLLENVLGDVYFNGIKTGDDPDPAPPAKPKKPPVAGGVAPMPGPIGMPPGGMMGEGGMPGVGGTGLPSDQEDPAITLRKKQQRLGIKANATSWALYYYLLKNKPAELQEYVAELNKLPRDLPIDGPTAYAVFVRVFKLSTKPDGSADPAQVKRFAAAWYDSVLGVPLASHDVPLSIPVAPKTPMGGMGPMGSMGPGPGGRP